MPRVARASPCNDQEVSEPQSSARLRYHVMRGKPQAALSCFSCDSRPAGCICSLMPKERSHGTHVESPYNQNDKSGLGKLKYASQPAKDPNGRCQQARYSRMPAHSYL